MGGDIPVVSGIRAASRGCRAEAAAVAPEDAAAPMQSGTTDARPREGSLSVPPPITPPHGTPRLNTLPSAAGGRRAEAAAVAPADEAGSAVIGGDSAAEPDKRTETEAEPPVADESCSVMISSISSAEGEKTALKPRRCLLPKTNPAQQ